MAQELLLLLSVSWHHSGALSQMRPAKPMEKKKRWKPQIFIQNPYVELSQIIPLPHFTINKLIYITLGCCKYCQAWTFQKWSTFRNKICLKFLLVIGKYSLKTSSLSQRSCAVHPTCWLFFLFILSSLQSNSLFSCTKSTEIRRLFWWFCNNSQMKWGLSSSL